MPSSSAMRKRQVGEDLPQGQEHVFGILPERKSPGLHKASPAPTRGIVSPRGRGPAPAQHAEIDLGRAFFRHFQALRRLQGKVDDAVLSERARGH